MKVIHLLVSGQAGGIESLLRDYVNYSQHENLFAFAWEGGPAADQMEFFPLKPALKSILLFTRGNIFILIRRITYSVTALRIRPPGS